ncbi:Transposase and inactivated derivatives [Belnapia rosea]|nr:Transposase and inactivated derivatives [Belnapia rosea]
MPRASHRGRKPSVDLREVLNAIRYLACSGGGWRMLPIHFGPWQTVYWWFRGYDGGKRIVGRKRHVAVDTDGRRLLVNLSTADVLDSASAQTILTAIRKRWLWLKQLFADAGYDRTTLMDKATFLDFVVGIVRHSDPKSFHVLPRRWVVERTFGWMIRSRRLVRDYKRRLDVSEAMIHVSMGALLLRRIAHR